MSEEIKKTVERLRGGINMYLARNKFTDPKDGTFKLSEIAAIFNYVDALEYARGQLPDRHRSAFGYRVDSYLGRKK